MLAGHRIHNVKWYLTKIKAQKWLCVFVGNIWSSHWPGFVESTEPQEISWDRETDLRPWEDFKARDPGRATKGQEQQVKSSTMIQR